MKFLLIFLLFFSVIRSQNQYPKDYFISPLSIPLNLSGSFGELRNNHFHAGLDLKTEQREGLSVYAVADGYVSRIKVSAWGYGKSLYITHPNGYTTVYAHLLKYSPKIEDLVKKRQYDKKSFEIEIFLLPEDLKIKQGDVIALSGNSGGSGGPHLHFEFRDSKTQKIINPLCFGFDLKIPDTKKPSVVSLMVYPIGNNSRINKSLKPSTIDLILQKDGSYLASKILAQGKVGFGINTYDTWDNNYNKNGVFRIQTYLNGRPYFKYQFETFAFNEDHYINTLIDYSKFKKTTEKYQKLFMHPNYPLSIIDKDNNGIINVVPGIKSVYRIEISDYNNNKTVVIIPIQYDNEKFANNKSIRKTNYFVIAKKENNYKKENGSVFIPANTFYENFYLDFDFKDDILTIGQDTIAAHKNMIITFDTENISDQKKEKLFIASINENKIEYNHTIKKGNSLSARIKKMGKFTLSQDTIPPTVKGINFTKGKWMTNEKTLELEITDSISGIKEYNAYLNGKWILMEYDYKTNKIIHSFADAFVKEGENELKVMVKDKIGNTTIFETFFYR